jgi:hypothetical protein
MSGGSVSPSCPSGGTWFICVSSPSQFVGCCKSDPCKSSSGCPAQDLTAASFEPAAHGTFPDQSCPAGQGNFYTCTFEGLGKAPFIGCCRTNACLQGGCPAADLGMAALATNSAQSQPFITAVGSLGVVSSATVAAVASTTGTTRPAASSAVSIPTTRISSSQRPSSTLTSSTSSTSPSPASSQSLQSGLVVIPTSIGDPFSGPSPDASIPSKMSKGSIAGVTIAGIILISALAAIIFFICTRRRRMAQHLKGQKNTLPGDNEASASNGLEYSSGGLFTPQKGLPHMEEQHSSVQPPPVAIPAYETLKSRRQMEYDERYGYNEQGSYGVSFGERIFAINVLTLMTDYPAGRYYSTPSPNHISPNHISTSSAPPYDLQVRYSTPPSFPPHPALLSLHTNYPHPIYQQNPNISSGDTIAANGYAVPMLPPDVWPATTLTTVHEANPDDEDTVSESTRSSGTVMIAAGTGSPKPNNVGREYTTSVMLARSPAPPSEGRWSGLSRHRSMVGEVYDNLRD